MKRKKLFLLNVFLLAATLSLVPCAAQDADTAETPAEPEQKTSFWNKVFRGGKANGAASSGTSYAGGVPESLQRVQEIIEQGPLADDPKARFYLDLVARDQASPAQMATFGSYLTEMGIPQGAIEYYKEAVRREPDNAVLWLNTGTVYRLLGEDDQAIGAYEKAVELDPFMADAHYNLGAAYDALNQYDRAVEQYMLALTINPSLADPVYNPQVVNNERMTVVQLILYQRQVGARGLPLLTVTAD